MVFEKKRTARAIERAAANRAENETRHALNVVKLEGVGVYRAHGQDRPSRVLRAVKRERARRESAELLERIAGAYEVPEGGDAA